MVLAINTTSVRMSWLAVQLPSGGIHSVLSFCSQHFKEAVGWIHQSHLPSYLGDINNLNPNGVYQFSMVAQVTIMEQLYSGEMDTSLVNTPTITPGKVPLVTILQSDDM